jgi:hypothetical protein
VRWGNPERSDWPAAPSLSETPCRASGGLLRDGNAEVTVTTARFEPLACPEQGRVPISAGVSRGLNFSLDKMSLCALRTAQPGRFLLRGAPKEGHRRTDDPPRGASGTGWSTLRAGHPEPRFGYTRAARAETSQNWATSQLILETRSNRRAEQRSVFRRQPLPVGVSQGALSCIGQRNQKSTAERRYQRQNGLRRWARIQIEIEFGGFLFRLPGAGRAPFLRRSEFRAMAMPNQPRSARAVDAWAPAFAGCRVNGR